LSNYGTGASDVGFHIVYQSQGGTALTDVGSAAQFITVSPPGSDLALASLSAVISGLTPGAYLVGLAGSGQAASVGPTGTGPDIYAYDGTTSALVFQTQG
jgi:hypothetical protein